MTKQDQLMERAAAALSMEPAEIVSVDETADGLVAVTKDNNAMVINEDQDPPVQFLVPPKAGYQGSFPVLHPDRDPLPAPPAADTSPADTSPADAQAEAPAEPAPPAEDTPPAAAGVELPPLPDGVNLDASVGEIVTAVGDDPTAAAAVLAHEQNATKPRKSLVAQLEALTEPAPPAEDTPPAAGGED